MAGWVRRGIRVRFRRILGFVKDAVAIGRARATRSQFADLHVALIAATSHEESPASEKLVQSVLSAGTGSRMCMSYCICLLMNRLNKTKSWIVAVKCLVLIHKGLRNGGFIFQDQLSVYPSRGGRNYLNLSNFKDRSSPFAWEASSWILWYAKFLEVWLLTFRKMGNLSDAKSAHIISQKVECLQNDDLVREILMLNEFLQEICGCPMFASVTTHELIKNALRMVILDSIRTQTELRIRLREVCQRLNDLTNSDISRVIQVCERLTSESMSVVHLIESGLTQNLLESFEYPDEVFFTDYELMKIKNALKGPRASAVRMNVLSGTLLRIKMPSVKISSSFPSKVQAGGRNMSLDFTANDGIRHRDTTQDLPLLGFL